MYLNKIKLFLVISFFLSSFFLTLKDVKSYEIKVVDGDTIHLNGKKIRFSGIDTPELKQTCSKNDQIIFCGIEAKKLLINGFLLDVVEKITDDEIKKLLKNMIGLN